MTKATKPIGRVLRKILPGATNILQTPTGLTQLTNGWRSVIQPYGGEIIVLQDEFDMSGYTREDWTFYPGSVQVQQSISDLHHPAPLGPGGAAVRCWDIVTTQQIREEQLQNWMPTAQSVNAPGFPNSPLSLTNVIWGRFRQFHQNSTIVGVLPLTDSQGWGLLSETAGSKIYITRIYQSLVGENGNLNIPDTAWVIVGGSVAEKEYVHIEQLRRVYDVEG